MQFYSSDEVNVTIYWTYYVFMQLPMVMGALRFELIPSVVAGVQREKGITHLRNCCTFMLFSEVPVLNMSTRDTVYPVVAPEV